MRFRVLGSLEVADAQIRAAKHRILLATLLLRANRRVSIAEIAERLWGKELPEHPRRTIQIYVLRLRKELGNRDLIDAQPDGYRIRVDATELDLAAFGALLEKADAAHKSNDLRVELEFINAATALWRGEPVPEIRSDVLQRVDVGPLVEQFLRAQQRRIDICLRLGRHAEMIPDLQGLVRHYPLRERLSAQLMVALCRAGRQADAVAVYRNIATRLVNDLGLEPGKELRRVHQMVLSGTLPAAAPVHVDSSWVVQRQLPLDLPDFVGRDDEIRRVTAILANRATVPIVTISGPHGVGKSALAVRVAHRIASEYPDGQWYLRPDGNNDAPAQLLADLLVATGVDGGAMPATIDGRAALLRARMAGRRVLLFVDGVVDAGQVAALLPGTPGNAVIVTSREPLPELTVRFGARGVSLGGLSPADSTALLNRLLGGRVDSDIATLARRCAGSPLMLRRAATELLTRTDNWNFAGICQVK